MTAFGFVNMVWFSGVAHSKQLTCRFSGKLKFSPIIATNEYVKKRYQMVWKKRHRNPQNSHRTNQQENRTREKNITNEYIFYNTIFYAFQSFGVELCFFFLLFHSIRDSHKKWNICNIISQSIWDPDPAHTHTHTHSNHIYTNTNSLNLFSFFDRADYIRIFI